MSTTFFILALQCLSAGIVWTARVTEKTEACGPLEWMARGTSSCVKVLPLERLQTYEEAKNLCCKEDPEAILVTVTSEEEQSLVSTMLQSNQSIWLSTIVNNSQFIWPDGFSSKFALLPLEEFIPSPGIFCLELQPGQTPGESGNWRLSNCTDTSGVICEKLQNWSPSRVKTTLLQTQKDLLGFQERFNGMANELENLRAKQSQGETLLGSIIPIGFVYIQYGNQVAPTQIWKDFGWADITSSYAGQFFRALGGDAEGFGSVQNYNCPRISHIQYQDHNNHPHDVDLSYPGLTPAVRSGNWNGGGDTVGLVFKQTGGEVRPLNSAVRIWKRIS